MGCAIIIIAAISIAIGFAVGGVPGFITAIIMFFLGNIIYMVVSVKQEMEKDTPASLPSSSREMASTFLYDPDDEDDDEDDDNDEDDNDEYGGPQIIQLGGRPTKRFPDPIAADVRVAGISRHENTVLELAQGTQRGIILEREPGNQYDENAIKVIARWKDELGQKRTGLVGYVPRRVAEMIARKYPEKEIDGRLVTIYMPGEDKNAGMIFDIYTTAEGEGEANN